MEEIEIILPEPHKAQRQVIESDARFKVLMCGRRFGKSLISQALALKSCSEAKKVAYITPTYLLAKSFFLDLEKSLPPDVEVNRSDLTISINGGLVRFFTGERLDNLRGLKFHLVIIDESSYIPDLENGWLNSIRPTLTDYKGEAIFLSTPRGKNYFYSLYVKGQSGEPDWQSFKFSTYDNPHIDPSEIDDAKDQLPPVVFEQEYMANPAENASNPFGSAFIKQCTFPMSHDAPICFGIDLAKSHDWTVITGLDKNGSVCYFDRFQCDWRTVVNKILALPNIPMCIDSTGVGDPIGEEIARSRNVELFRFTSQSKQQIMEGLAMAIQQRKITFPEGIITDELGIFEYQYTATGVKYSAPSGFHDDCVCSLALAWHKYRPNQHTGNYSFL